MHQQRFEHDFVRLYAYGDTFRLVYFKTPVRVGGFEDSKNKCSARSGLNDAGRYDCNISRAKSAVTEIALCNQWDWFVTLTLDAGKYDRYDLHGFQRDLSRWVRNQRRNGGALRYLLIPEQHKDGAWHMHGLFAGIPQDAVSINQYGYYEWGAYSRKFGFMSMSAVRDSRAVARYITKYITKDFGGAGREKGEQLYFASRGLRRRELLAEGALLAGPAWTFENEYVKSVWLDSLEAVELDAWKG